MEFCKQPVKRGSANDPYMINPKGARVMVPAVRVKELLSAGFVLEDKMWKSSAPKEKAQEKEEVTRNYPISRTQLLEDTKKEIDTLEVWEV